MIISKKRTTLCPTLVGNLNEKQWSKQVGKTKGKQCEWNRCCEGRDGLLHHAVAVQKAAQRWSWSGRLFPWRSPETQESTSNAIDFTGKSTRRAGFSIIFATKYLCAWTESRWGRTSSPTLIQTQLSCWILWTVLLSWLSNNFINTSLKPGEHAGRPEDVCLEIEISWRFGWRHHVCPDV